MGDEFLGILEIRRLGERLLLSRRGMESIGSMLRICLSKHISSSNQTRLIGLLA